MDGGSRQTATSQRGDRLRRRRWRRRRAGAALGAALGLWLLPAAAAAAPQQQGPAAPAPLATGFVFHDRDRDGSRDPEEPGLARVAVSNGREVALTGESGRWILPLLDPDDTTFFVIKPQGWMVPLTEQRVPRFHYSHKPSGSPRLRHAGVPPSGPLPPSIDFPLHPQHEPAELRLVLLGDPQPRDRRELGFLARDVVAELIGLPAAFGVALGDLTFDDLTLFEPLNEVLGQTGFPWFFVLGNHDLNQDAREDRWSDETFERVYGPSYYAFDWGPAHFVVLDDVVWTRGPAGAGYRGGLGQQQLEFLRHDLALVPRERPVVLFMHVPLTEVEDRAALYRLLQARPHVFSVSAHRHYQRHVFIGEEDGWRGTAPHHHLIQATASGDWWQGLPDERGHPARDHARRSAQRLVAAHAEAGRQLHRGLQAGGPPRRLAARDRGAGGGAARAARTHRGLGQRVRWLGALAGRDAGRAGSRLEAAGARAPP
ncbi:MAG: hypothetical protein KatS3mg102_1757 [Planctomycetota bacterium]|nr:MAG: hypothetical protein KatS3mg102_1757 [Planctomycetota bacterium]